MEYEIHVTLPGLFDGFPRKNGILSKILFIDKQLNHTLGLKTFGTGGLFMN